MVGGVMPRVMVPRAVMPLAVVLRTVMPLAMALRVVRVLGSVVLDGGEGDFAS